MVATTVQNAYECTTCASKTRPAPTGTSTAPTSAASVRGWFRRRHGADQLGGRGQVLQHDRTARGTRVGERLMRVTDLRDQRAPPSRHAGRRQLRAVRGLERCLRELRERSVWRLQRGRQLHRVPDRRERHAQGLLRGWANFATVRGRTSARPPALAGWSSTGTDSRDCMTRTIPRSGRAVWGLAPSTTAPAQIRDFCSHGRSGPPSQRREGGPPRFCGVRFIACLANATAGALVTSKRQAQEPVDRYNEDW